MALKPAMKGAKASKPSMDDDEEEAPASEAGEDAGGDYKSLAKDAAKDGDWDAMVDALCSYIDNH